MPVSSQLLYTQDAFQYAAATSANPVCAGKGKGKAAKKGAATEKLLPPLIFSIESWEAQLITLSTASEACTALIFGAGPHWLPSELSMPDAPQAVLASTAAPRHLVTQHGQSAHICTNLFACSAGKVNLMAHAKRSTNRDFKLNKRPAQPRSAAVVGAMGVDARAPPEVRRQQPTLSIHPASAAATVADPSAHSEVSYPASRQPNSTD